MNKSGMQNCSFSLNLPHCFRVEHHFILASLFPARWPENLRPVSPITQLHHPLSPLKSHPHPRGTNRGSSGAASSIPFNFRVVTLCLMPSQPCTHNSTGLKAVVAGFLSSLFMLIPAHHTNCLGTCSRLHFKFHCLNLHNLQPRLGQDVHPHLFSYAVP